MERENEGMRSLLLAFEIVKEKIRQHAEATASLSLADNVKHSSVGSASVVALSFDSRFGFVFVSTTVKDRDRERVGTTGVI
jgi:hypothetical protein